jgi:flavin reductase (DIM6/NTAB) family NADH-FMN oxidoreductase RutF
MSQSMSPDTRRFRNALGQFPTGVTVITTVTEQGERLGMTVSSFNSLSLDPPLVLFSVRKQSGSIAAWREVTHYAINVLNEEQEDVSARFARPSSEQWTGQNILTGRTGVPLLSNAAVTFECEAFARYDGGDHEIFVGQVVELHENAAKHGRPLVFAGGQYRRLHSGEVHALPIEVYFPHGW